MEEPKVTSTVSDMCLKSLGVDKIDCKTSITANVDAFKDADISMFTKMSNVDTKVQGLTSCIDKDIELINIHEEKYILDTNKGKDTLDRTRADCTENVVANEKTFINSYEQVDTEQEKTITNESEVVPVVFSTLFSSKTLLELSKSFWSCPRDAKNVQPYIRGCKWSPDGTCCLSMVNNDGMHVVELSHDLYYNSVSANRPINILNSVIHIKEAGLVYDFVWYPGMNSNCPETCSWITTRQNGPVQMWDAFDGALRCTYRGFNSVDEMEPALSVTFNADGSKVIAGYKKALRTFDTERPGRDCSVHPVKAPASCMATCGELLAVGSWNTSIGLYSINEMGTYKSLGKMHGHTGGVTHMKFTPDGQKLVTGARKDHRLLVWDLRNYRRPLNVLTRSVDTNQRIYFDISPCGRYLVSGGTDGVIKVWDSVLTEWSDHINGDSDTEQNVLKFPLHNDCCNSVSIHPCRPILATGSGQYHSVDPISSLDVEGCAVEDYATARVHKDSRENYEDKEIKLAEIESMVVDSLKCSENSLLFWWIGDVVDLT